MYADKKVISNLAFCYCVAPLEYRGSTHYLVASEKEHECLLFDKYGKQTDVIWDGPGGTMSAMQVPDTDGVFLASQRFYSPDNSKEARIVLCYPSDNGWHVCTVAELPHVHRFGILKRNGINYIIACILKSDYEGADDWRFPGATLACALPDDLFCLLDGYRLPFVTIKDGMLKNHGYSSDVYHGYDTAIVSCDSGVFRFIPPENAGSDWQVLQLTDEAASDAVLVDLDNCGEKELVVIYPFHGDEMAICKLINGTFQRVYKHLQKLEFAHAICCGTIGGKPCAFIGHRKGDRAMLAITRENGEYSVQVIDSAAGAANAIIDHVDGNDVLIAANREINEIAYYTLHA